jgi:hypothetical protein
MRGEDFKGHVAVELLVVGAIDFAHSAGTNFLKDAIVAKLLAQHGNPPAGRELYAGLIGKSTPTVPNHRL